MLIVFVIFVLFFFVLMIEKTWKLRKGKASSNDDNSSKYNPSEYKSNDYNFRKNKASEDKSKELLCESDFIYRKRLGDVPSEFIYLRKGKGLYTIEEGEQFSVGWCKRGGDRGGLGDGSRWDREEEVFLFKDLLCISDFIYPTQLGKVPSGVIYLEKDNFLLMKKDEFSYRVRWCTRDGECCVSAINGAEGEPEQEVFLHEKLFIDAEEFANESNESFEDLNKYLKSDWDNWRYMNLMTNRFHKYILDNKPMRKSFAFSELLPYSLIEKIQQEGDKLLTEEERMYVWDYVKYSSDQYMQLMMIGELELKILHETESYIRLLFGGECIYFSPEIVRSNKGERVLLLQPFEEPNPNEKKIISGLIMVPDILGKKFMKLLRPEWNEVVMNCLSEKPYMYIFYGSGIKNFLERMENPRVISFKHK